MDGSTNETLSHRNYLAEIEQGVRESEANLARMQERFDREEARVGTASSEWSNKYDDRLAEAKTFLKSARARLTAYKKLPFEELEAEVLQLKRELYPDRIHEALEATRPIGIAAAIVQVKAYVNVMAVREEFFGKLRRLRDIERSLLSDEKHDLPPSQQPGFRMLEGSARPARETLIAELEKLIGSDDELAKSLTRDEKGGLVIAGLPARIALDWAHIV